MEFVREVILILALLSVWSPEGRNSTKSGNLGKRMKLKWRRNIS